MQLSLHATSSCSSRCSTWSRRSTQPCMASSTPARQGSTAGTSTSCSTSSRHQHEQQQEPQVYTTSRRGSLAMLSLGLASCFVPTPAAQAASTVNTANKALADYMALDSKGKLKDKKALDDFRARYGIRRSIDGRVSLQSASGDWYSVRLDMEVPGAILLRRDKDGCIFALETENLAQVDLSDDYIIMMMFADGAWEQDMAPIEFEEETGAGGISQLQLPERDFREFVGLLKELNEDNAAPGGQDTK